MLYYECINKQMDKYINIESIDALTNNLSSFISLFMSVFQRKSFLVFAYPPPPCADTHTYRHTQIQHTACHLLNQIDAVRSHQQGQRPIKTSLPGLSTNDWKPKPVREPRIKVDC